MLGYPGSPGLGSKVRHVGYYVVKDTDAYCNTNFDAYCILVCDRYVHRLGFENCEYIHTAINGL